MGNWSSFKDGIEYEDIRKFFLNKCKELGLKSKYRNGEITFEDVDSYDYFMGNFSDDGVLSIYYPFTLKKEYFMSNFEDYDEFLAQFIDIYDSAMIEKRLHKTESKKFARKSLTEKELKMDVWEWGDVKGTDEELCNHIAEYAEEKGIEYMEITEDEFEYLKKDYLKKYKSMKESTEITEPRMAWISLLNHVCNFSNTIHSDSLWKALKKNPREEITLDEFVDECEKFVDMTKIRGMIEDYLGNDKQIEDNLKMYGLWNFSDKFAESKSAKKSLKEGIDETLIGESKDGQFSLYLSDQRRANHGKDPHYEIILATNGYFTKYVRTDDKKAERVVSDWITLYDIDLKGVKFSELFESKKSACKSMKESSNKKVSDFENTNTKFIAIMDIEDFYDEDGNTSVLWQGKSSDLKKSDFYDFAVLETETYDKVLYLFIDIAEF